MIVQFVAMRVKRNAMRVGQLCVLLIAGWLLFHWWRSHPPGAVSDDAVDDLIEEVGDTYVPVHVATIERGTLKQYVTAYGTVQPAGAIAGRDAGSAQITSPTAAVVATVDCSEGHHIGKGQSLFTLDSRAADATIAQAQQLIAADEVAASSIGDADPATPHWRIVDIKRQLAADMATLASARAARSLLSVVAPISGTVTSVNIAAGTTADPTKVAIEIVDLDRLVATVDIPASDLPQIHVGQLATIPQRSETATTQPSSALAGSVALIDPAMNPATGMGSADIAIPPNSGLRPGEFVRVQITTGEEPDRLFVPSQSITENDDGEPAVGTLEKNGRWAVLVPVKTGWRDGDKIEIEGEGIDAGQQVVTTGANGLVRRTRLFLLKD